MPLKRPSNAISAAWNPLSVGIAHAMIDGVTADKVPHPDHVVLRGWGVMNPVDHSIGNVWSNSEEDALPAGDAATRYTAIPTQASGNLADKAHTGSVCHNLGILNIRAVRIAQAKFGTRTLTGDEVRWL